MRFVVAAFALVLSVSTAFAIPIWISPALRGEIRLFPPKFVISGGHVDIWTVFAIRSDCRSDGLVAFKIRKQPMHGTLRFVREHVIARYPGMPGHHACEGRRVWGQVVQYRSDRGYTGSDLVEFEAIFPNGRASFERLPIYIR